jgi:hypothetical protein
MFLREMSEGRPGTKYTLVRDISPYADNVYSSKDDSSPSKPGTGVAFRVVGSKMIVGCNEPEGRLMFNAVYELLYYQRNMHATRSNLPEMI